MDRWLMVINPRAGNHPSMRWHSNLAARLHRAVDCQVIFTNYPGHATEIARSHRHLAGIGVLGGDGTLAEVVNGMDINGQKLLVFPAGTGNGMALDLGMHTIEDAFSALHNDRGKMLDLVKVEFRTPVRNYSRLMLSTSAVGYVADVVSLSNDLRRYYGAGCYLAAAVWKVLRSRPASFSASVDLGRDSPGPGDYTNLIVNNTCHAGNFPVFKQASLQDGRFEVELTQPAPGLFFLLRMACQAANRLMSCSKVYASPFTNVRLKTPHTLMIDGELWENVVEATYHTCPKKLNCLAVF